MKQFYLFFAIGIKCMILFFTLLCSKANPKINQVSLYWFTGAIYTGRYNTHSIEAGICGCPGYGPIHCEDGYDANDFITTGNPTSGLKANATINDFIRGY